MSVKLRQRRKGGWEIDVRVDSPAPTLRAFAPRFMDGHARANRQKPSGIAAME